MLCTSIHKLAAHETKKGKGDNNFLRILSEVAIVIMRCLEKQAYEAIGPGEQTAHKYYFLIKIFVTTFLMGNHSQRVYKLRYLVQ